jgi:hypothetical protein
MIARTESLQAWLENVTYQMTHMNYKDQADKLAGYMSCRPFFSGMANRLLICSQIAFLKSYSTRCAQDTARDAVQIFGGRGVTKSGMGKFIEHVRSPLLRVPKSMPSSSIQWPIVPQNNSLRCHSWRNRGRFGRSWC